MPKSLILAFKFLSNKIYSIFEKKTIINKIKTLDILRFPCPPKTFLSDNFFKAYKHCIIIYSFYK